VAVSIADRHMLEKKMKENDDAAADWYRKAERAVDKKEDDLARAALERHRSYQKYADSYREQVTDQKAQVEHLKTALGKLEEKLQEAKSKRDLLIARHRRSVASSKASRAQMAMGDHSKIATFELLKDKVHHAEAVSEAERDLTADGLSDQLGRLEKEDEIERVLTEIKARRTAPN
jgi:phage shock protein A